MKSISTVLAVGICSASFSRIQHSGSQGTSGIAAACKPHDLDWTRWGLHPNASGAVFLFSMGHRERGASRGRASAVHNFSVTWRGHWPVCDGTTHVLDAVDERGDGQAAGGTRMFGVA